MTEQKKPNPYFIFVAAGISAVSGLLFGYDTGVISGAILFIQKDFALNATWEEIVVSSVLLGAMIGASFGGVLADRFGRRITIILTAFIFIFGSTLAAFAPNVLCLVIGRLVIGAAIGVASFTSPLYISEISPLALRGRFVSFNQIAITIGIVVAYGVDYAFAASGGWRWMFGLAIIPSALLGVGMFVMPESPRWLISRGLTEKARAVLARVRGTSAVDAEIEQIKKGMQNQDSSWRELTKKSLRPALIIGIGLAVFQQLTGINTVIYYAPIIFQSVGFKSSAAAILATTGVGLVNVLVTLLALKLIDKVGRRPLLLYGIGGMIFSLSLLGVVFLFPENKFLGLVAAGSVALYVASFAIGLGPVFWLLISEIYPLNLRGRAMGIASIANWGANLLVALTFLTLFQSFGRSMTFWLYAVLSVASWYFAYKLVPETKERSLEEIETQMRDEFN